MATYSLSDVQYFVDEPYNLDPTYMAGYFGNTVKMMGRNEPWKGYSMHEKAIMTLHSGARMTTDLEADMPTASTPTALDIEIAKTELRECSASVEITDPAGQIVDDPEHSAMQVSKDIILQMEAGIQQKMDQAIHSNTRVTKATVAAKYDEDGTTYTSSGTTTVAFLQIADGSISNFQKGSLITVRNGSSTSGTRGVVTVNDVCYDTSYYGVANIGPGILVTAQANGASTFLTNLDDITADDELVDSGEGSVGWTAAFDNLIPTSWSGTLAWFSVTDRRSAGYQCLIPYRLNFESGGSAVDLDVDTHFGRWSNLVPYLIPNARTYRKGKGIRVNDALVWLAEPKLINEIARQVGSQNSMFTREFATSLTEAQKTKLIGHSGFDGAVLHYPNLPPIVLQSEPLCKPNRILAFDPSAWKWIRLGEQGFKPTYLRSPGTNSIFTRKQNSGALSKTLMTSAYVQAMPYCDCPQTVFAIDGVKSSI